VRYESGCFILIVERSSGFGIFSQKGMPRAVNQEIISAFLEGVGRGWGGGGNVPINTTLYKQIKLILTC
jgi:hypothetical protein